MKDSYPAISLVRCCCLLGITRQAYYQHYWHKEAVTFEQELIIQQVQRIRALQPAIGVRKLYLLLQPFILEHQIKLGRDAFFDLMSAHQLLVRRKKRRVCTTQ